MLGLLSPLLSAVPGVSHRFFGRVGGTSPAPWTGLNISHDVGDAPARVDENLARTRFQIGVGKDALFTAKQVHGAVIVDVDAYVDVTDIDVIRAMVADGLVTRRAEAGVAVRTADCAPVLLAVDDGSAVAAVHAGWRGAVGGVIDAAVAALGVPPARIVAAVGPCIGFDAFEVGPEVVSAAASIVDIEGIVRPGDGDRQHLDLAGLCERLLKKAGVERVDVVGGCTVSQPSSYFSHRRDNGSTGRQLSAIARASPPDFDSDTFR